MLNVPMTDKERVQCWKEECHNCKHMGDSENNVRSVLAVVVKYPLWTVEALVCLPLPLH